MNKTVLEAIKKTLPSTTTGVFKEFVEEAKATESELRNLKKDYDIRNRELTAILEKERKYADLEERENTVKIQEREIELYKIRSEANEVLYQAKIDMTYDRILDYRHILETIFLNRVTREAVLTPITVKDQGYGDNGTIPGEHVEHHEIVTETEEK